MGNMLGGIWWELQGEMGELSLKTQYVYSWNLQRITKNTVRKTIQLGGKRSIVIYQCLDSGLYLLILFLCKQWKLLIMKNPVPGSFPFTFYVIRHYSSFQWLKASWGERSYIMGQSLSLREAPAGTQGRSLTPTQREVLLALLPGS